MTLETTNTVLQATGIIAFTDRSIQLRLTAQEAEHGTSQSFVILVDDNSKAELRKYRGKLLGLGEDRAVVFSVPIDQIPAIKNSAKLGSLTRTLGNLHPEDIKFVDLLEVRDPINDVGSYPASMFSPDAARLIAMLTKVRQQSTDQGFRQRCTTAITDQIVEGRLAFDLKVDYLADKLKFVAQQSSSMSNQP